MGGSSESRIHCHQIDPVEVSQIGSPVYFQIASVSFTPFDDGDFAGDDESKIIVTEDATGVLAGSFDSTRFNFSDPGGTPGSCDRGTIIRDLDVSGSPFSCHHEPIRDTIGACPRGEEAFRQQRLEKQ